MSYVPPRSMRAWSSPWRPYWRSPAAARSRSRRRRKTAPPAAADATASDALEGQVDIVAWPGYIERGETDKDYDWVTSFEQDTGCKVNIKTAGTSDEMVSLMTQGGLRPGDGVGDASLRLIRGGTVQPVDVDARAELRERRRAAQASALALRRRQALRHAVPVGPERADVQHQGVPDAAEVVVGRVRGTEAAGRQEQQGPHPGLRRPDLHRRRRAVPDGEEARPRHQGPVRTQRGSSTPPCSSCCASSTRSCTVTGTTRTSPCRTSRTKASSPRARGRSRSTRWSPTSSRSRASCPPKARRGGPTRRCSRRTRSTPTARTSGWSGRSTPRCRATWPRGSAPCRPCPRRARATRCSATRVAPTNGFDNFDKIRFWRTPEAACAQGTCVPYSRWATDYVAVMGGR